MKTYLLIYLGSALLALVITPIVIRIAHALRIYDKPDVRKVHAPAIPRIGGVAIFLSATSLTITTLFLDNRIGEAFRRVQIQVITLLAAGTFIFLAGLIDDLRGMRVRYKLLAQVCAAVAVCIAGIRIDALNIVNLFTFHFGWLSYVITIFWIVSITNAVNLIDGLDGLAAGISAVVCIVIAIFAFEIGQPLMVVLMLALLGSLCGFLFFNFNPARIFMGDCGSMFLGFVLASSSVLCATKSRTIIALALPTLALGLPIFDTISSMLRRYLNRWGIMSPDRGHLHHILLDMGLRHHHVVIIMYALTALAAGLGMFMMLTHDVGTVAIFFCVLLLLMLVFRITGAVRLRDTIAGLKQKNIISQTARQEMESFEKAALRFHQVKTFDEWWQAVCIATDTMGFVRSSLPLTNRDGTRRILVWEKNGDNGETENTVKMTLPIRDRRYGSRLNLEAHIYTNSSLESVGRRISLFARLIEEHSITNLPNKAEDTPTLKLETARQLLTQG
jgi:UDP-N-acetylmuramyl pentapeptide phosphotransferase/UDP-N-acetylglucosamine-1-phosphate transferase